MRNTTDAYGKSIIDPQDEDIRESKKPLLGHRGYEKFFSGYTEYTVIAPNGRKKIKRMYTGMMYQEQLTPKERVLHKLLMCILYSLALGLLIFAMALDVPSNHYAITSVIAIVPAVVLIRIFYFLLIYIPAGSWLTIHEFRDGVKKLPKNSIIAIAAEGLLLISTIAYSVWQNAASEKFEFLKLGAILMSLLCMLLLHCQSRRVKYEMIQSTNKAPQGGIEINAD